MGLRLPDRRRREGAALRGRLERLGLYRASGHEHFSGSLTIPVLDAAGAVVGLYGRKVTEGLRAPARPCICICPACIAACGILRASPRPPRTAGR